jgi:penicillin-binding protein 1C
VAVCAESGDLPNAYCPQTIETWYIPGKSPIRVSQLHRAVGVDPETGAPTCPPYAAGTRVEVFEYWSSDMLKLFRQSGMPRRTPPSAPECAADASTESPRIASPLRGVSYALRRSSPQEVIALDASAAADVHMLYWLDGSALIGARPVAAGPLSWRPADEGMHLVRVVDDRGRATERDVEVRFVR